MSGASEQRNPYKGRPPRPWVRVQLLGADGSVLEIELVADTGNPFPLIISEANLHRFTQAPAQPKITNFGPLTGGSVHVVVPEVGFDDMLVGYGSDAVVASTKRNNLDFEGLLGLPVLRMLEYGGDADWFWIRPQSGHP